MAEDVSIPSVGGAIGGALAGGLAAGITGKYQTDVARQSSEDAMRFSERMASSQYQRGVADLRAAGLNPILAATGGLSDQAAAGQTYAPGDFGGVAPALGTVSQSLLQRAQLREQDSRIRQNDASSEAAHAAAAASLARAGLDSAQQGNVASARDLNVASAESARAAAALARINASIQAPSARVGEKGGAALGWTRELLRILRDVKGLTSGLGGGDAPVPPSPFNYYK